jgi:hypothetical protein
LREFQAALTRFEGEAPAEPLHAFSEIGGDYGSKPLYRNLGYFSLICLLRVHVLLGDPTRESAMEYAVLDHH